MKEITIQDIRGMLAPEDARPIQLLWEQLDEAQWHVSVQVSCGFGVECFTEVVSAASLRKRETNPRRVRNAAKAKLKKHSAESYRADLIKRIAAWIESVPLYGVPGLLGSVRVDAASDYQVTLDVLPTDIRRWEAGMAIRLGQGPAGQCAWGEVIALNNRGFQAVVDTEGDHYVKAGDVREAWLQ